ncbi:hypothetical protein Molly5_50 [Maribacter phage Molly_5]|uniref:GIY-YIG domain-containing protein n=1 Tax=Maribacter phage Molly_1 TaxID=2745685 RepID=A0A8E4XVU4_9CAUD|nr:hypothetical protein M1M29_gp050 [Maribacter phage Molly_1]QQO97734.1 hypothetical protein Molly2_50 [Maribacter phage Molly_2]QQO97934.1 hypothetical protein Molly3_50 [Maribacter phage Molly_3]QQO98134.1 hypothetical protein Molly4_50 [Maribacter phage Molly_4]QQO98334.1 hypothetical protein Molly5_50 [Maribacter phage Molly_5]QQO97534.1 hypothetical protein Molly1_50 [Maribacter phage Molly_1]
MKYYVYILYLNSEPIYVGKGSKDRVFLSQRKHKADKFSIVYKSYNELMCLREETRLIIEIKRIQEGGTLRNIAIWDTSNKLTDAECSLIGKENWKDPVYRAWMTSKRNSPNFIQKSTETITRLNNDPEFKSKRLKSLKSRTKLSKDQIGDIYLKHKSGYLAKQLATEYRVHPDTISNAINNYNILEF